MAIERKLLNAARRILHPLVRILLRNGIPSDALTELVRQTYVDVADEEFGIDGKRQTTARISVITGLNRKEVARLRGRDPLSTEAEVQWNRAATVLGGWLRDGTFLDKKGDPLDLPFDGDGPTFQMLVKRYSGDMQPRAVADELLRVGAVEEVDGRLRMTTRGYVPSGDPESVADILGIDTAEFIETVDHNMTSEDKLYQMKVLSTNVPARYLEEFNAYSRRLSHPVLEELNRWLAARDMKQDWTGDDERVVLGLGIYQVNRRADRPDSEAEERSE
ncbi:MAG: DUF6502 family protein [Pseudomonadales bacterium]|nr:hypothetical protein [Pseudomonadales bacterium]